jgi:hypothetical protein
LHCLAQIADAMSLLESYRIVHRDLAARYQTLRIQLI